MQLKGNRKFIVVLTILGIAAIASLFNKLLSSDLASVLSTVGAAFMGGNAVEHWSRKQPAQPEHKEPEGD